MWRYDTVLGELPRIHLESKVDYKSEGGLRARRALIISITEKSGGKRHRFGHVFHMCVLGRGDRYHDESRMELLTFRGRVGLRKHVVIFFPLPHTVR